MHISNNFCIFANQIYKKLNDMSTFKCNKKKHVSDYFRIIDSETKAYVLGYLVAALFWSKSIS